MPQKKVSTIDNRSPMRRRKTKGQSKAEEGQADAADSGAQDDTSEELTKVKDQLLRTVAEMENVRRRAQRDVENAHKFAVEKLLSDLLPVVDSLEKAEEAAKTTDQRRQYGRGYKSFTQTIR